MSVGRQSESVRARPEVRVGDQHEADDQRSRPAAQRSHAELPQRQADDRSARASTRPPRPSPTSTARYSTSANRSVKAGPLLHSMAPAMSYEPSPPPPLSRASLVIGLYTAMGIVAFLIAAGRGDPDLYRLGGSPEAWQLGAAPVMGIALGARVVGLTRLATALPVGARPPYELPRSARPVDRREIVILALASSIGEELLFRGALLPWFGVWIQAAVFAAAAHRAWSSGPAVDDERAVARNRVWLDREVDRQSRRSRRTS